MPMPMMTGYQRDEPEMMDNPMEESMEPQSAQSDTMNAQSYGPSTGRTGADVIAACLNQPTVRPEVGNGSGTTAPQGEMEYGADPGYGV